MKRKSVKIVALALSLICCFSTAVLFASAEKQTQTYEFSDDFYTSRTSTHGTYKTTYLGNYYGAGNGNNGGRVTASAVGGPVSNFETYVVAQATINSSRVREDKSSEDTGSNSVSAYVPFSVSANQIVGTVNGYTEYLCRSLSNSSDTWMYNTLMYWNNNQDAWQH